MEENNKTATNPNVCEECKKERPAYKFGLCLDCYEDLYRNENLE